MRANNHDVNTYLYRVREKLGWTLREAAERAGISFSRLGEIERGRDSHTGKPIVPSYVTLCRLAAAYGLPPADLLRLAGHDPGPELTAEEWVLLDAFRLLRPECRANLLASLRAPVDVVPHRAASGGAEILPIAGGTITAEA